MRKAIFCVLSLLAVGLVHAQSDGYVKGYVVVNQDTTYGYILDKGFRNVQDEILFKTSLEQQQTERYGPDAVQAFFFEPSNYYETKEIQLAGETSRKFLQKLVDGYASLYQYWHDGEDGYLITKAFDDRVQLEKKDKIEGGQFKEDKRYIGLIRHFFQDCQEIAI